MRKMTKKDIAEDSKLYEKSRHISGLVMLVGELIRSGRVMTIGERPRLRSHGRGRQWPSLLGEKPRE